MISRLLRSARVNVATAVFWMLAFLWAAAWTVVVVVAWIIIALAVAFALGTL